MTLPTTEAYAEVNLLYDFFNDELFGGELPGCLITLQRGKKIYGFFRHKSFIRVGNKEHTDEIALNPAYFPIVPLKEICQTMVHEQVHQWQAHYGAPGRRTYHNQEWGRKMKEVGLMPSHTGKPGGRETGEQMADYAIEGGVFEQAFAKLMATDFKITWLDQYPGHNVSPWVLQEAINGNMDGVDLVETLGLEAGTVLTNLLPQLAPAKPTRSKYSCKCKPKPISIWGKPGIRIRCLECFEQFEEVVPKVATTKERKHDARSTTGRGTAVLRGHKPQSGRDKGGSGRAGVRH